MPKVSVIVPVYNMEKYVERCLKSLVNQTLKDIEIIVVNDGSTDRSKEIIKKFNNRIKYFEKQNGGLSSARNYGIRYATGEYIAFLDSDDYVEKTMYEVMYNIAIKEKADMVECDFLWEWDKYSKKDKRRNYKSKKDMMKKPRVVAWNKLIKAEIISKNNLRFPDGLIYEDLEFFYKLLPYLNKIEYINKYFVHYTQRPNSISNTYEKNVGDIFKILENIFNFYKQNELYNEYKNELIYMKKRILLGSSIKRILKVKNKNLKMKLIKMTFKEIFNASGKMIQQNTVPKIIFGITSLGIGGAERVLVDMVNNLCDFYDITIFTIYSGGELEEEIDSKVHKISMCNGNNKNNKIFPIYVFLFGKIIFNKYIDNNYDLQIAFLEGPITRIFSHNSKKKSNKKIAWVHNDISKVFGNTIKGKIKNIVDKYYYKKYDKIIFVSNQNKQSFEKLYGSKKFPCKEVTYNYIDKNRILKKSNEKTPEIFDKNELKILTVTRLVKQKGIDRLIRIHKRLINEGIKHKIYVIGSGEEEKRLKKLATTLNVEKTFIFLGKKENPYPYIKMTDYFTLLSYYEGYGMVLEEAKILDKPIIVTDTAAKEAVQNYDKAIILKNGEYWIYEGLKNILLSSKKVKKQESNLKIDILTATYNREKYLPNLYNSIKTNLKGKELSGIQVKWIVIDDGSTDNTKELIQGYIKETKNFSIKYIYQSNMGKMAAINRGMEEVTGDVVVDCDSDDFFTSNAFEIIKKYTSQLLIDDKLYGMCFLKQDLNGKISGKSFKPNYKKSTMFDLYFKDNIEGEKILVFKTKVRKEFKHELEKGEKFITEARMYHKMDKNYKILCINEVLQIGEYICDGYSKNIQKTFIEAPKGYYEYFKEIIKNKMHNVKLKKKIYVIKHFFYFWVLKNKKVITK